MARINEDDLTTSLQEYYCHNVKLKPVETRERYGLIQNVLFGQIMPELASREPRIDENLAEHGSFFQHLRAGRADEFDFGVRFQGLDRCWWQSGAGVTPRCYGFSEPPRRDVDIFGNLIGSGGKAFLEIPDYLDIVQTYEALKNPPHGSGYLRVGYRHKAGPMWADAEDLVVKRDFIPFLAKQRLMGLLYDIRNDLGLHDEIKISQKVRGPAIRIYLKDGDLDVGVDLAPMVQLSLPFPPTVTWPRPGASWPNTRKVQSVLQEGVNLVAKKHFYWVESYAEAEAELVRGIDADGGNRKKLHKIMKKCTEEIWCNTSLPEIASYDLKNLWFWTIEKNPDTTRWQHKTMGARFLEMTYALQDAIQKRHLPHYFDQNINLFKNKKQDELDIVDRKISRFLEDPELALSHEM